MPPSNSGKYKAFANQSVLYGPSGSGQNLNDDLQKAIADELDGGHADFVGDGTATGWLVTPSTGLSVAVASGQGYVSGQRIKNTAPGAVTALPTSTTGIKIYVQAGTTWSPSLAAWPSSFGFTTGALGPGQLLLATVDTGSASVTNVVDARIFVQTQSAIAGSVDDGVTPAASAISVNQRISMLASRVKAIIGGAGWLSSLPADLTTLVAALLGHTHSGGADGTKLDQADTHQSPDTDSAPSALHHTLGTGANQAAAGNHTHAGSAISNTPAGGIAATTVQAAINELDGDKSNVGHTHAASDVASGTLALARIASGSPNGSKFVRDDQTLAVPPGQPIDIQTFTTPGNNTWTKPAWATATSIVEVILYGGGGGGSSYADGEPPAPGVGGGGGAYCTRKFLAGDLNATETAVVGGGGGPGGGGGQSSFKTAGANGGIGGMGGTPGPGGTGLGNSTTTGWNGGTGVTHVQPVPSIPVYGAGGGGGTGSGGAAGNSTRGGQGGNLGSNGGIPGGGGGAGGNGTGGSGARGQVWVITYP